MKTQSTKIWTLFSCVIIAVCLFIAASAFSNDDHNLILENTEALSDGEVIFIDYHDIVAVCDAFCVDQVNMCCILTTIYGFPIYCVDMEDRL